MIIMVDGHRTIVCDHCRVVPVSHRDRFCSGACMRAHYEASRSDIATLAKAGAAIEAKKAPAPIVVEKKASETPQSFDPHKFVCSICNCEIDDRRQTVWNKVSGWEKRRQQGGTNHVVARRVLNEFACDGCIKKLKDGVGFAQNEMFQNEPR